jgi:hypothetical protein
MGKSGDTNRHDYGGNLGPMPQSAHFQTEPEIISELIERAESLPIDSASRRSIEERLSNEFNLERKV